MRTLIAKTSAVLLVASSAFVYHGFSTAGGSRRDTQPPTMTSTTAPSIGVAKLPSRTASSSGNSANNLATQRASKLDTATKLLPATPDFACPYPAQASSHAQVGPSYQGNLEAQYHWRDSHNQEQWCDLPFTAPNLGSQIDGLWQNLNFCDRLRDYMLNVAHKTNRWNGCSAPATGTLMALSGAKNVLVLDYRVRQVGFNFDANDLDNAAVKATTDVTISVTFAFADSVDGTTNAGAPAVLQSAVLVFANTNFDFQDGPTNTFFGGKLDEKQKEMDQASVDLTSELAPQAAYVNGLLHFGARVLSNKVPAQLGYGLDGFGLSISIDGDGLLIRYERNI